MLHELAVVVQIANKLVRDMPRNLDIAHLAYEVRQLARAVGADASTSGTGGAGKRWRRRPGYWAERKRIQRAKLAQSRGVPPGNGAS
jgi:hypothetical protein